ncbi:hypothetical protein C1646_811906 [Rhizophagus diaphanus]|nr:hypothetical protein C1646_811906 [Rhizophagus diaphanus] [Rhizophagus sp. MUCL 43196]
MRSDRRLKEKFGTMDYIKEKQFYQLTLSNELWLRNGKKYGQNCIGMDSKHDLNNDRTPVLVIITENNSGSETPLSFGISNKENQWTIKLSITVIKTNIPCNQDDCEYKWSYVDLPNDKGFKRIRECNSSNWNPLVMIDKHKHQKLPDKELFSRQVKEDLVTYFKNKERIIFSPKGNIPERNSDPFRPPELKYNTPNKGAPPKAIAKPRKSSRILQTLQSNSQNETNTFASEKRNIKRTRKNLRNTKSFGATVTSPHWEKTRMGY